MTLLSQNFKKKYIIDNNVTITLSLGGIKRRKISKRIRFFGFGALYFIKQTLKTTDSCPKMAFYVICQHASFNALS